MKYLLILTLLFSAPLCGELKVLAFSGSDRKGSFNQKLAEQAAEIARQKGATVQVINLSDYPMPIYNADLESRSGLPENVKKFRNHLITHDYIIISSPEYNGLLTALLKNAIDWASREDQGNYSTNAFKEKRFAIMSASPGDGGGQRSLDSLRQLLNNLGGNVIQKTVSVPAAHQAFDSDGKLMDDKLHNQLDQEISELLQST